MIHIVVCSDIICVTGHAGAGPPGQDPVCAAVSALLQTFVRSAQELTDTTLDGDIAPGGAFVRYEESPAQAQAAGAEPPEAEQEPDG